VLERIARLTLGDAPRILDVGCGTGQLLPDLGRFGAVTGVDVNARAVEYARDRGSADVHLAAAESLPFASGTFELVTCLDVLEHVGDDLRALTEMRRVTAPGGYLLLSVPAHPALWSGHDVAAGHARRYAARDVHALAAKAGWQPVEVFGFNALLLPFAALFRAASRLAGARPRSHLLLTPRWLDPVLERLLRLEAAAVRRGRPVRRGLSIIGVFRNPSRDGGR